MVWEGLSYLCGSYFTLLACSSSTWVGLIIFLIYIGGLLVIFSYFVALMPNLTIEAYTMLLLAGLSFFLFLLAILLFPPFLHKIPSGLLSSPMITLLTHNSALVLLIVVILFLALVAVVKICSLKSTPLRPFS